MGDVSGLGFFVCFKLIQQLDSAKIIIMILERKKYFRNVYRV